MKGAARSCTESPSQPAERDEVTHLIYTHPLLSCWTRPNPTSSDSPATLLNPTRSPTPQVDQPTLLKLDHYYLPRSLTTLPGPTGSLDTSSDQLASPATHIV